MGCGARQDLELAPAAQTSSNSAVKFQMANLKRVLCMSSRFQFFQSGLPRTKVEQLGHHAGCGRRGRKWRTSKLVS